MFDIGFFELLLIGVVALLVVGPERLPDAVRTVARWWSGVRRILHNAREELEREVGTDDIRRELHNERVMRELEESRREMEQTVRNIDKEIKAPLPEAVDEQKPRPGKKEEAQDYLPEQEENAADLQDPEYPEHWHDHGDPALNPDHDGKKDPPLQKKPKEKDSRS